MSILLSHSVTTSRVIRAARWHNETLLQLLQQSTFSIHPRWYLLRALNVLQTMIHALDVHFISFMLLSRS
jgi:hypothetical protein